MAKVELNTPAPDFNMNDYQGETFQLSDYQGKKNVLLIFNRTFT